MELDVKTTAAFNCVMAFASDCLCQNAKIVALAFGVLKGLVEKPPPPNLDAFMVEWCRFAGHPRACFEDEGKQLELIETTRKVSAKGVEPMLEKGNPHPERWICFLGLE